MVTSRKLEPKATLHTRGSARAGRSPSARRSMLCAAAVLTALTAAAAAQSAERHGLKSPELGEIGRAAGPIRDSVVTAPSTRALAPNGYWGGEYRTSAGEIVTIYASNSYPQDQALGQRWANFLATLVHGSEISSVIVLLSTPGQIEGICGQDALACYSSRGSLLYAPAEDPVRYESNPGEGWAETYRVLNQRRLGVPESPWEIVSRSLYPSDAALAAAERDVTSPWGVDTTTTRAGSVTRTSRTRTYTVATPLDGTLKVTLRSSAGLRAQLDVCGARSYRVRVTEQAGRGSFRLSVAEPAS